jgi:hypothetical protein
MIHMINQTSYEKFGAPLYVAGENVVYDVLRLLTRLNKKAVKNPEDIYKYRKAYEIEINKIAKKFDNEWKKWADYDIPSAYLAGLNQADKQLKELGLNQEITKNISNGSYLIDNPPIPPPPEIPGQVLKWFDGWENQTTWMGVFRNAAYYNLDSQPLLIIRKGNDIFREVAIMAGESSYSESDIFTRRAMSQKMLDEYTRRGIQTITYKNGAKYSIDSYCEMAGRAMTGRAAVQASLNRYFQSGYTLVVVSSHFRACPLCEPYEGVTLSMEPHPVYETIADAETQGLFHARCSHDVSVWFEGIEETIPRVHSGEQKLIDMHGYKEAQKISYEAQQKQRYIERNIRTWKRRAEVSLSEKQKQFANSKIREWQARQRDHLKENTFLPRKYSREQIRTAH